MSELEEIGCIVLELGYFIDFLGKGFQDPLSVVLSLTGEEQEEERLIFLLMRCWRNMYGQRIRYILEVLCRL